MDSQVTQSPTENIQASVSECNKKPVSTLPESESDGEIEVKKPPKQKRELTEKQKENLQRGRQRRNEAIAKKKEETAKIKEQEQEELNRKIVKKAILIKKREIKKEQILTPTPEETEVEDEPVKAPRKKVNYPPPTPPPQKPQIVFL
jgi:hypothetical protein